MYSIDVSVEGVAPLLQHKFPLPDFGVISTDGTTDVITGQKDYSEEWRNYLYVNSDDEIYQPATHFDGAMVKAAVNFKVKGKRGKTFKDLFKGNVFCSPDEILHGIKTPDDLDNDADKPLYLDMRPVVVSRARIVRIRPAFSPGWKLDFEIEVLDDQIPFTVVSEVLSLAGKTIGIGDFRPRFGRFIVTRFEVQQ